MIAALENKLFRSPKYVLYEDGVVVLINHPRPVSRYHFVITPQNLEIHLCDITKTSKDVLMHMKSAANITVGRMVPKNIQFVMGFLATDMNNSCKLQLHVLSTDMAGPFMNEETWKVFTTKLFIPVEDVQKCLQKYNKFYGPTEDDVNQILFGEVRCRHCDLRYTNYKSLQQHLKIHYENKRN